MKRKEKNPFSSEELKRIGRLESAKLKPWSKIRSGSSRDRHSRFVAVKKYLWDPDEDTLI